MYEEFILGGLFGAGVLFFILYKMWKRQETQEKLMKTLIKKMDELGGVNIRELVEKKYSKERDAMFEKLIEKTEISSSVQNMNTILADVKSAIAETNSTMKGNAKKLKSIHKVEEEGLGKLSQLMENLGDLEDMVSWVETYLKNEKRRREQRKDRVG